MSSIFSYWIWFGIIYLVILTFQDFKNNRLVDDRHNYFMSGVTASLFSHVKVDWYKIGIIVAMTISLLYLMHKYPILGEADKKSILWIFTGFAIIGYEYLIFFLLTFMVFTGFYFGSKYALFKYHKIDFELPTPFYWVLFFSFFTTSYLKGLI